MAIIAKIPTGTHSINAVASLQMNAGWWIQLEFLTVDGESLDVSGYNDKPFDSPQDARAAFETDPSVRSLRDSGITVELTIARNALPIG